VIAAGEAVMMIVPRADTLVIDAKIAPQDVDQVAVGSSVGIRILAGNRRTTPLLQAVVMRISPDLLYETHTDRPYYLVRLGFAERGLREVDGLHLLPGMPVEAFIATDSRTPLEYLLKPLTEQIARTFRER
jgi:HlyD family secretion protein